MADTMKLKINKVMAKFNKYDYVTVTKRNGEKINGMVQGVSTNLCTFGIEYDVDYWDTVKGCVMTMICIPESAVALM